MTLWHIIFEDSLNSLTGVIVCCINCIVKPKYHWKNDNNFENGYLEAGVGESPIVHFTMESESSLVDCAQHTLTKDGKPVTKRFIVQSNSVKFKKVRLEDSGTYTISCSNDDGLVGEDTIELDVFPTGQTPSGIAKCSVSHFSDDFLTTSILQ